jgi:hypothetical protein
MRPNQNNKNRQRGRNNNGGRKHVNPLSRNFESNGPDVKVRGNAAHIAEKYLQLARDAQSSGDPVLAENYLQHAEHYFRIVAAAQAQSQFRPDQPNQQPPDLDEDDDFPPINDRFASPEPMQRFQQPQQQPAEQPGFAGEAGGEEPGEGQNQPVPAEASAAEGSGEFPGQQGDGEGRRHRDRNRRRRGRGQGGDGNQPNGDPAAAPQPEIGELPAFLTAGGSTTVAE